MKGYDYEFTAYFFKKSKGWGILDNLVWNFQFCGEQSLFSVDLLYLFFCLKSLLYKFNLLVSNQLVYHQILRTKFFLIWYLTHCIKSVRIRPYSGPYFLAFGVNTETYSASLYIQSECEKIWTRITPNTDTFYAVTIPNIWLPCQSGYS